MNNEAQPSLYTGRVNFTMTGDWQLDLILRDTNYILIDSSAVFNLLVD
jgi:hypothetical protein